MARIRVEEWSLDPLVVLNESVVVAASLLGCDICWALEPEHHVQAHVVTNH